MLQIIGGDKFSTLLDKYQEAWLWNQMLRVSSFVKNLPNCISKLTISFCVLSAGWVPVAPFHHLRLDCPCLDFCYSGSNSLVFKSAIPWWHMMLNNFWYNYYNYFNNYKILFGKASIHILIAFWLSLVLCLLINSYWHVLDNSMYLANISRVLSTHCLQLVFCIAEVFLIIMQSCLFCMDHIFGVVLRNHAQVTCICLYIIS